jgi:hypothetical protein
VTGRPDPPSGAEPPHVAERSNGQAVPLDPLARDLCDRYFAEYPDHIERYGTAGDAWCVHDSLYLLAWAIADHDWRDVVLREQALWLADVLEARGFPLDRLARHLELAAVIVRERGLEAAAEVAARLDDAGAAVRARV